MARGGHLEITAAQVSPDCPSVLSVSSSCFTGFVLVDNLSTLSPLIYAARYAHPELDHVRRPVYCEFGGPGMDVR